MVIDKCLKDFQKPDVICVVSYWKQTTELFSPLELCDMWESQ